MKDRLASLLLYLRFFGPLSLTVEESISLEYNDEVGDEFSRHRLSSNQPDRCLQINQTIKEFVGRVQINR